MLPIGVLYTYHIKSTNYAGFTGDLMSGGFTNRPEHELGILSSMVNNYGAAQWGGSQTTNIMQLIKGYGCLLEVMEVGVEQQLIMQVVLPVTTLMTAILFIKLLEVLA